MADNFVGVDLGKLTDPTALTIMCRSLSVNTLTGLPEKSSRGDHLYRWEVRALKRYKLGTPYLAIVADVLRICNRRELQPAPRLVLDATGVGVAVTEMFTRALVDFPDVECHTISITAGEGASAVTNLTRANMVARGQWRVSKIQLIGAIREVLESRRFKVSKDPQTGKPIEFAEVLVKELTNFREKITESANLTYEARQGQHDDLVLATCLPIWLGSQRFCHMATYTTADGSSYLRPRETIAVDAARAEAEQLELAALELERSGRNLHLEREEARQKRREGEIEANLDSDEFWDHGGIPARTHSTYFIIAASDPEVLDGSLAGFGVAAEVFRDTSGKPVQRRGGFLVESFGHAPFARRLIESNALGEIVAAFERLEEV
jgi:hypothetical protein